MSISPLVTYLSGSTEASLESFELARLNARSNVKKKLTLVLAEYFEEEATARLARLMMSRTSCSGYGLPPLVLAPHTPEPPDELKQITTSGPSSDSGRPGLADPGTERSGVLTSAEPSLLDRLALFVFRPPSNRTTCEGRREPLLHSCDRSRRASRSRPRRRSVMATFPRPLAPPFFGRRPTSRVFCNRRALVLLHRRNRPAGHHRRRRRSLVSTWFRHRR